MTYAFLLYPHANVRYRQSLLQLAAQELAMTLPGIRGTVLFVLIELTIGGFNVFTSIKMITGGKPAHQTDTLLTWMYYKAFSTGKFGYAAALSFVMALTLGLLAIVQFRAMKSRDE